MRLINFLFLYILVPVAIIFLCFRSGNWYGLFGLIIYFLGIIISKSGEWIYFPIPLMFAFWYWYTYGMGPTDYVFLFTLCFVAGVAASEADKLYHRFVNKVLPEQLNNIEYNEKVEELNRRIDKYRLEHPGEKITAEIIEKIRTEVFF